MSSIDRNINIDVNNRQANQQLDRTSRLLSNVDKETRTVSASNRVMTEEVTKNGGAMALLNTVTGGLAQQFKDGYEAAGLMVGGLKGLRGAIIATGIGALAVGLGLVLANLEGIRAFLSGGGGGLSSLDVQMASINQSAVAYSENLKNIQAEEQIKITEAKKRGASDIEILKITNSYLEKKNRLKTEGIELDSEIDSELEIAQKELAVAKEQFENSETYKKIRNDNYRWFNDQAKDLEKRINSLQDNITSGRIDDTIEVRKFIEELKTQYKIVKAEEDVKLNSIKNLTEEGKKLIASEQKVKDIQRDILVTNSQIKLNQVEINRLVEEARLKEQQRLETVRKLRDEFDGILKTYEDGVTDARVDAATAKGGFFSNLVRQDISSIERLNDILKQLKEKQKELQAEDVRGSITGEQKDRLDFLNSQVEQTEKLIANTITLSQKQTVNLFKGDDNINNQNLQTLINLQNEYDKLSITILEFEKGFEREGKWIDDRNNNSKQFFQIEDNLNKLYQKQTQIIEKNKAVSDFSFEQRLDQNAIDRGNIKSLLKEEELSFEQRAKLEAQLLDLDIERNRIEKEQNTINYGFKKELELADYDLKIELARNLIEQKQMMRDEELERERQYYDGVTGIANESAGFLDAMAAHGGKSSQKFAEAALKIKKFAGVANVAISAQEEIRGIWANPALTALPDTGVTAKTALTAGAIVRAGLSTATILKQRLGSSPSSSSSIASGGAPQFNIVESNGTNQLSARIGQQQNQPVQAYVVGSSVTSQQALDRAILNNSTFL